MNDERLNDRLTDVEGVAAYLDVKPRRVYEIIDQIPHLTLGKRQYRFDLAIVRDWAKKEALQKVAA
jgi:hypothetical protein